ncbi:hypothetical protein BU26DRAFT_531572 [Trematosphaeria pertusa]|uniref:Indole-diterpene biosynthesis protein-like protein PaxU n=1 Tax=Trematosphaeria pertusa TaxID=390896 RepID=A0A6A6ICN2_9PLEO|nr:uncharacterized protein BU26DRAFT_531572 [Trematosphaeria pertusa]KAF2248176.1 hypothetical protein BU26DRAFT_531572 [Trematosphaeria pertusa]
MATAITPAVVAKPLSDFHKIGHNTYLSTPGSYTSKEPLILLFSWNAAAAKHIAKYTVAYRRFFPTARIVLIRCHTPDMFRREARYEKLLRPAIETVQEHSKAGGEVLVHSFSNGGGNQVTEFAKAWRKLDGSLLPMRAQILDSSPGKGGWKRSHAAISASLPRTRLWGLIGSAFVHMLLAMVFLFESLTARENKMVVMCRQLNDGAIFDVRTPRVYLYSRADEMVGAEEVEEHADRAMANGWHVAKVRFDKSAHAGHVREDEGMYWGAILEAWKSGRKEA